MLVYKNGQNFIEYVLLIVALTAALFAMQTYVRRGVQGKLRDIIVSSDFVAPPNSIKDEPTGVKMYINTVSNVTQSQTSRLVFENGKFKYVEETSVSQEEKEE